MRRASEPCRCCGRQPCVKLTHAHNHTLTTPPPLPRATPTLAAEAPYCHKYLRRFHNQQPQQSSSTPYSRCAPLAIVSPPSLATLPPSSSSPNPTHLSRLSAKTKPLHRKLSNLSKQAKDKIPALRRQGSPSSDMSADARETSSSPLSTEMNDSDTSETASTGNAGQKIAGNVPIPAFLRQSKGEIHKKFIDLEWQQRNRLLMGTQKPTSPDTPISPWKRVMGEDVTKRNRYFNVDPFVANRVRLKVPEGHSDYINASPIKLFDSETHVGRSFIATQGPKEDIAAHMWRMIWHETTSPAVIVMLTQTHESGKEKCFQYFPHSMDSPVQIINENDEFGDGFTATLTLKSIEEDTSTRSTIRELELKNAEGETKVVWHLLFGGWPDFLIPEGEDRAALIKLVALSSSKNAADSPRIVHCSAGVGRSGTFIALDYLLHELEEGNLDEVSKDEDPISDAVDELRKQRMMMVQGEQQYWFLYDVLRDLWVERWLRLKGQKDGEGNVEDFVKGQVESTPEVEAERVSVRKRGELEMELQGNVDRL